MVNRGTTDSSLDINNSVKNGEGEGGGGVAALSTFNHLSKLKHPNVRNRLGRAIDSILELVASGAALNDSRKRNVPRRAYAMGEHICHND